MVVTEKVSLPKSFKELLLTKVVMVVFSPFKATTSSLAMVRVVKVMVGVFAPDENWMVLLDPSTVTALILVPEVVLSVRVLVPEPSNVQVPV